MRNIVYMFVCLLRFHASTAEPILINSGIKIDGTLEEGHKLLFIAKIKLKFGEIGDESLCGTPIISQVRDIKIIISILLVRNKKLFLRS